MAPVSQEGGTAMDGQQNQSVLAEVLLRSSGGRSVARSNEPITAANVIQYYSTDDVVRAARQRLESLGFDVVHSGPLGLTIRGNKALFERVFHTHLARAGHPAADGAAHAGASPDGALDHWTPAPPPHPPDSAQPDRDSVGEDEGWVAQPAPVTPPSLRDVVEAVVLPSPMSYH
jgi:hypothetical protein